MNRRSFLSILGLGALGLGTIGFTTAGKKWTESEAFQCIVAHTTLDNERLLFEQLFHQNLTWENQMDFYENAVRAVEEGGLDPMGKNFWEDLKAWNKKLPNKTNVLVEHYAEMKARRGI